MRALLQRVSHSSVKVEGETKGDINEGLLIFIGITSDDIQDDFDYIIKKSINLRIFNDEQGVMNVSCEDLKGRYLLVSQFTLCASTKKGNRPSYIYAAPPQLAKDMFDDFVSRFADKVGENRVEIGQFGAEMKVSIVNEGPVTIWLDSKNRF